MDDEILAAQERLVEGLVESGASVKETQPAAFGDLRSHHRMYSSILGLVTSSGSTEERHRLANNMRATGDEFQIAMADGIEASGSDFIGWLHERELFPPGVPRVLHRLGRADRPDNHSAGVSAHGCVVAQADAGCERL